MFRTILLCALVLGLAGCSFASKEAAPMADPRGRTDPGVETTDAGGQGQPSVPASAAVRGYRAYLERQSRELVSRTRSLVAAVLAGDVGRARALFAWARGPYGRIEPVAQGFEDLDRSIDARRNDVTSGPWLGFHRIEEALWVDRSLVGTRLTARRLLGDVEALERRISDVPLEPSEIAEGATEVLGEVTRSVIPGEEDRYAHTELWDLRANVDGVQAAFTALAGLIDARDPRLAREIRARFVAVGAALRPYRSGRGFVLSTSLAPQDTRRISQAIDALAEPLSRVAGLLASA